MRTQLLLTAAIISSLGYLAVGKHIFCYYSSFAYKRHSVGNFVPEDINPYLCSHIIYAFVDITSDGTDLKPGNWNDQGPDGLYARTLALKEKNPSLKVLLAVGGWNIGSDPFVPMIRDEHTRGRWIQNVLKYVRNHGFDGFDMDWEFPATRGSPPEDKYRFTLLMKGLYEAFAAEARDTGKEKLLLTIAAASGTYYIDQSYETDKLIHYIDYMFLMTYNYHGQWEKWTGHHSGLYAHKDDPKTGEKSQLYQEWSIDYWLDAGISKDKLVVGIPTYGMTFTLADPGDHGVRAPVIGGGHMGEYTRETGILAYYEICANLRDGGWKSEWIHEQSVPYAYGGDQWAGYEDKRSISAKASNILKRDLAGAFVWSVEMDDFGGVCGEGNYPLLTTITDSMGGSSAARPAAGHPEFHPEHRARPEAPLEDEQPAPGPVTGNAIKGKPWKKGKKMAGEKKSEPADPTTPSPAAETASAGQDKLKVTPWTQSRKTWHPANEKVTTTGSLPQTSPGVGKRLRYLWRRKFTRKYSSALPKLEDGDESSFGQTAKWWSLPHNQKSTESLETAEIAVTKAPQPGKKGLMVRTEHDHVDSPHESGHQGSVESGDEETEVRLAICKEKGMGTFPDPFSCDHFIICMAGSWSGVPPHVMACPPGTKFDEQLKICNYSFNVHCHQ